MTPKPVSKNGADTAPATLLQQLIYWLALLLVIIGLVNVTPAIPGWDNLWQGLTGLDRMRPRRFPTEWLYPIIFVWMMLIVVLKHSIWNAWADRAPYLRGFGLVLDIALVFAALATAGTYLIEIESVCLIDVMTGDRARMVAEALKSETEFAELYGLPKPDTAEDPNCLNTTDIWLPLIIFSAVVVFLAYNIKVWGLPLVLVSIMVAGYMFVTVMNWYFFGLEQNKYLITILSSEEPRSLASGRDFVHDALISQSAGLLGRFMNVLMLLVFPYIILGALFGQCAGGQALIKLAFSMTRNLRGGPAHAAVVSSAMFGTITGGPVVNVLSTGVLTIPMMLKRGFSKVFAGGVEAAASSGGSIMPPIMGVAAFVMAALTGVPYREIIIAAIIPALFYFFCLFLSVVFQARKQKIEAVGNENAEALKLTGEDKLHLAQIFGPVLLILVLLLLPKDSVGCSWISVLLGAEITVNNGICEITSLPWIIQLVQNAAGDASAAGWWAVALLLVLMFLDRAFRARPRKILDALSKAGVTISTLYLMFLAVTVIDVCLNFTGLSKFVAVDVLAFLKSFDVSVSSAGFQMFALILTMLLAVLLGMGMPAVPAYINVALLMGPMLVGLGLATFTAHMFIFYFAVASAITPPVALAAFAATTITKADPMATGFSAVKSGIVMFTIPFAFALYPELLLIDKAVIDPTSGQFLAGYDGSIDIGWLALLLARLALALYLVSSALSAYDFKPLGLTEIALRLIIAVLILFYPAEIYGPAIAAGIALIWFHIFRNRKTAQTGAA